MAGMEIIFQALKTGTAVNIVDGRFAIGARHLAHSDFHAEQYRQQQYCDQCQVVSGR